LKGKSIWILGFFTILSVANVVNSTIMWFGMGPTITFTPYLIGGLTGPIPVYVYTLISVLVMLAFLGVTSHRLISELSVLDEVRTIQSNQETQQRTLLDVQNKVIEVDEGIDRTSSKLSAEISDQAEAVKKSVEAGDKLIEKTSKKLSDELSSQGESIKQTVEAADQNQQKLIDALQGRMFLVEESIADFKKQLGEQTKLMKNIDTTIAESVNSQLNDVRESLTKLESRDAKTATAITKQKGEIEEIKQKLESIEASLVAPKAMLNSDSNVEDVKGIGPNKTADLNNIGISSVSDLIMADPKVVATSLGSSDKTAEKLQGRAQLQMIPGIEEKDLLMLEELDIIDRKSLSIQDPIELGKKMNAIFKINLANGKVLETDKPTIDKIESWVKYTKS
jgi:predicted flap endonuclease-1-like 5' DNA nuclease